jgi:hypothetical protein
MLFYKHETPSGLVRSILLVVTSAQSLAALVFEKS